MMEGYLGMVLGKSCFVSGLRFYGLLNLIVNEGNALVGVCGFCVGILVNNSNYLFCIIFSILRKPSITFALFSDVLWLDVRDYLS